MRHNQTRAIILIPENLFKLFVPCQAVSLQNQGSKSRDNEVLNKLEKVEKSDTRLLFRECSLHALLYSYTNSTQSYPLVKTDRVD